MTGSTTTGIAGCRSRTPGERARIRRRAERARLDRPNAHVGEDLFDLRREEARSHGAPLAEPARRLHREHRAGRASPHARGLEARRSAAIPAPPEGSRPATVSAATSRTRPCGLWRRGRRASAPARARPTSRTTPASRSPRAPRAAPRRGPSCCRARRPSRDRAGRRSRRTPSAAKPAAVVSAVAAIDGPSCWSVSRITSGERLGARGG